MRCCVPNCIGNGSTFGIPKNAINLWQNALGIELKSNYRVCEVHFKTDDIIKTWVSGQSQFSVSEY